jgi:hypothetical protein
MDAIAVFSDSEAAAGREAEGVDFFCDLYPAPSCCHCVAVIRWDELVGGFCHYEGADMDLCVYRPIRSGRPFRMSSSSFLSSADAQFRSIRPRSMKRRGMLSIGMML